MGNFIKSALGFIILGSIIVGCFRSCLGLNPTAPESSSGIKEISFANSDPETLKTGDSRWTRFSVEHRGDDISVDELVFVSTDESVATITFEKSVIPAKPSMISFLRTDLYFVLSSSVSPIQKITLSPALSAA